jgi:hypothetical protein
MTCIARFMAAMSGVVQRAVAGCGSLYDISLEPIIVDGASPAKIFGSVPPLKVAY